MCVYECVCGWWTYGASVGVSTGEGGSGRSIKVGVFILKVGCSLLDTIRCMV